MREMARALLEGDDPARRELVVRRHHRPITVPLPGNGHAPADRPAHLREPSMSDTQMLIVAGYPDVDLAEQEFRALADRVAAKELDLGRA